MTQSSSSKDSKGNLEKYVKWWNNFYFMKKKQKDII